MADSIAEMGVLQPLLVRPHGGRFDLIYGHRRLAAAKLAKCQTVPVFFCPGTPEEAMDHTRRLVENLHREDLSPLDEARAYQQLAALRGKGGQRGLAKLVGKSQAHISKRLALLRLPEEVQATVDSGGITVSEAVELAKLADTPHRLEEALKGGRGWGGLEASVRRQVQEQAHEQARNIEAEKLRAAGVKVTEDAAQFNRQRGPYPLRNLPVDEEEHASLSCHGAVVPAYGPSVVLVCFDPQAHLEPLGDTMADQRAEEAARQAELAAARLEAARSRRKFDLNLLRTGSPAGGAALLMGQLIGHRFVQVDEAVVAELLALNPDTFNGHGPAEAVAAFAAKGPRNAQRAIYATGLTLGESSVTGYHASPPHRRAYFEHLASAGYTLSPYELELLAEDDGDHDDDDYEDDEHDSSDTGDEDET